MGIGTMGIAALLENGRGVTVLVADQPAVAARDLRAAWRGE
jgi:hypothetical protein